MEPGEEASAGALDVGEKAAAPISLRRGFMCIQTKSARCCIF